VSEGSGNDLPQTQAKQELALAKIVSVTEGAKKETETIVCERDSQTYLLPG
jgi:hypothetical protein